MEHKRDYGTLAVLGRFVRRRWKKPAQAAGLAAGVLGLTASVYFTPKATGTPQVKAPQPVLEQGVVESTRTKGVGAAWEGQMRQVAVRPGDAVKKGQLLFQLDTTPYEAALKTARAEAAAARQSLAATYASRRQDLQQYEAAVAAARRDLARARQAAQPQPAASDAEWTLSENGDAVRLVPPEPAYQAPVDTSVEQARLRSVLAQYEERRQAWGPTLQQANAAVAAADHEMKRIAGVIGTATRRSPMAGVVTGVYAAPGEWVAANVPLVRVDDPAGYRVVTQVDQQTRERLRPGVTLKLADGTRRGKVEKIENGWDRDVFQYYVWIKPADWEGLQPGAPVPVKLPPAQVALN